MWRSPPVRRTTEMKFSFHCPGTNSLSREMYAAILRRLVPEKFLLEEVAYMFARTELAGFRFQMYYSTDGANWTSAGADFLTSFAADANNNGFSPAPRCYGVGH